MGTVGQGVEAWPDTLLQDVSSAGYLLHGGRLHLLHLLLLLVHLLRQLLPNLLVSHLNSQLALPVASGHVHCLSSALSLFSIRLIKTVSSVWRESSHAVGCLL